MKRALLYIRRALGILILIGFLVYFLDIWGIAPPHLDALVHIQIVPLIMEHQLHAIVLWAVLTLLLGRVYCSLLCPLGLVQDAILRVKMWWLRIAKKQKSLKAKYQKPYNAVRYGVLGVVAIFFAAGITYPVALLDPYSNFGRIAVALFRPVVVWLNNIAATIGTAAGNYTIYIIPQSNVGMVVTIFAAFILVALVVMVFAGGRLWCNTLCPVGTALGLLSRFSIFKVELDKTSCNSCGVCAAACKANCIDNKSREVDNSRCVACMSCLNRCKKGGVNFHATNPFAKKSDSAAKESAKMPFDASRRKFLKGTAITAVALPATALASAAGKEKEYMPLPPGAISVERFKSKCTACQLCVAKCPTHVLHPAFLEHGLTSMMQPVMRFDVEQFCTYDCNVCTTVCPNDAITPLTVEEKRITRVGFAEFYKDKCKVFISDVDCGACSEHCPTQALHMIAFKDELTIPKIERELCIGCGGCESICPMEIKAVVIKGVAVQSVADTPLSDKMDIVEIDDFGF